MKKLFLIKDTPTNKISYYHLLLFLVALPFDRFYSELVLVSLAIHTLIHFERAHLKQLHLPTILLLTAVFLLGVLSTIYTTYRNEAFERLARQLAILIFPLILFVSQLDLKKYYGQILTTFTLTCVLTTGYLYIDAIRIILYHELPLHSLFSNIFLNHNFSAPIGIHATYLSMYLCLSLVHVAGSMAKSKSRKINILLIAAVFILLAGLLQLGSRAVLLALLALSILIPMIFFSIRRRQFFLIILSCSLFASGLVIGLKDIRHRLVDGLQTDLGLVKTHREIAEPRIERWKIAIEIFANAPWIGHGTGDEVPRLRKAYFDHGLYSSYISKLNAHNQYLSFALKSGLAGLLLYLVVLITGFKKALKGKNSRFFGFMVILTFVSFSENYLDVNKGIFFYAFFFSFFTRIATRSSTGQPEHPVHRFYNKTKTRLVPQA